MQAKPGRVPHGGDTSSSEPSRFSGGVISGLLATIALAVWKFKAIALVLLTKGKLLFLGLTKASTFFSMFASMGLYWHVFGGWLAVGLVLSIYVHEMGHVFALMRVWRQGERPLFIPGSRRRRPSEAVSDRSEARRAGRARRPDLGYGGCSLLPLGLRVDIRAHLGGDRQVGALINLFNLTPVWQLDGARAFRSLNRQQRWLAVASVGTAWALTDQGMLVLLLAVGVWHTVVDKPAKVSDAPIVAQYAILVMILSAMSLLPVPMGGP